MAMSEAEFDTEGLFFCDVDGLKGINDTFGHREGDLVLIRAADALEKTFRASDVVARLGGDEFVVLAAETSNGCEGVIQDRLARNLKKSKDTDCAYELSLSVGAARFDSKHRVTLGELMLQGDNAMHEQKGKRQLPARRSSQPSGSILPGKARTARG